MNARWIPRLFTLLATVLVLGACEDILPPDPDQTTTEDVTVIESGESVGMSTLVRNDNGVSMNFSTSDLEPGTVATIWWVVFNEPDACQDGCGADDLPDPAVDATVFFAAGNVIGEAGKAYYWASLPADVLTVEPEEEANQLIAGDGILKDPRGAEIHLVLRTHGKVIPELIGRQLTTFDAGCETAPPDLQGPNQCMNLQASVHM